MEITYQKIIDFMLSSGKRLVSRAGKIADIGITKADLTEEDLAIERGFKEIISSFGNDHILFAEEENDVFQKSANIWVSDPISGTRLFIKSLPHYAIVISHLVNHKAVFAAVYDPSVDELFTAYSGKGVFLNNQPIVVSRTSRKIILRPSLAWKTPALIERVKELLKDYEIENNQYSMAVNYCAVAAGRFDGVASFSKDSFPEFAGGFIIREAGGQFTNLDGQADLRPTDRIFVGGNAETYNELFALVVKAVRS